MAIACTCSANCFVPDSPMNSNFNQATNEQAEKDGRTGRFLSAVHSGFPKTTLMIQID